MKTLKNLLIGLFLTLFTINSFATVIPVTFNVTSSVTCSIGDTLKFYAGSTGQYYGTTNLGLAFSPTTVSSGGFIAQYKIVGGETSFSMTFVNTNTTFNGTITIQSGLGVNDIKNQPTIKLFPNPVVDILKVSTSEKTKINIFNINGQSVLTQDLEKGTNDVDVFNLSNGIYFVTVGNKTQKIVKQ